MTVSRIYTVGGESSTRGQNVQVGNRMGRSTRLFLLVRDLAHLAEACAGTGQAVFELEDLNLQEKQMVSKCRRNGMYEDGGG